MIRVADAEASTGQAMTTWPGSWERPLRLGGAEDRGDDRIGIG